MPALILISGLGIALVPRAAQPVLLGAAAGVLGQAAWVSGGLGRRLTATCLTNSAGRGA